MVENSKISQAVSLSSFPCSLNMYMKIVSHILAWSILSWIYWWYSSLHYFSRPYKRYGQPIACTFFGSDGMNRLNPRKLKLLFVHHGFLTFSVLSLDGVALPWRRRFDTWEVFLDSWILLKGQVSVSPEGLLPNLSLIISFDLSGMWGSPRITQVLMITHLDYCNMFYVGWSLKTTQNFS